MNVEAFAQAAIVKPRVAVCVGCGGVGKTTIAAALAVEAARRGRRVLVLTIDPARRLADALGVEELGNEPQDLPREVLAALSVPEEGALAALMLDMKRTFDDLVERFTDSPESRDRILENPIYQHVSDALSGSVEYSAMEKVLELCESDRFDLIVVDTPPAQHALDFLDAPQRLLDFLDSKVLMMLHPAFSAGRLSFRIFQRGMKRVLQVLERITGIGFLEDISEFLLAFEGMGDGFRERAHKVKALLVGAEASFILVTGPGWESVEQANQFLDRLEAYDVPLRGVLVNRLHLWPGDGKTPSFFAGDECRNGGAALGSSRVGSNGPESDRLGSDRLPGDGVQRENMQAQEALEAALAEASPAGFPVREAARTALETARDYATWVRRDEHATSLLRQHTEKSGRYWGQIPELADDVHDLAGLAQIADLIFRGNGGTARGEP